MVLKIDVAVETQHEGKTEEIRLVDTVEGEEEQRMVRVGQKKAWWH